MEIFILVLVCVIGPMLTRAYWSRRCEDLEFSLEETKSVLSVAIDNELRLNEEATDARNATREAVGQLNAEMSAHACTRTELSARINDQTAQLQTMQGNIDALEDRLAAAELICTSNLNKSFATRLPWPTVFARAFPEDPNS